MNSVEKYLPPGELSAALLERYGLEVTPDYLRVIRAASIARKDGVFVARCGRPSEVFTWIRNNPGFRRRSTRAAA